MRGEMLGDRGLVTEEEGMSFVQSLGGDNTIITQTIIPILMSHVCVVVVVVVMVVVVFLGASFSASFFLHNNHIQFQRNILKSCFSYNSNHPNHGESKINSNKH